MLISCRGELGKTSKIMSGTYSITLAENSHLVYLCVCCVLSETYFVRQRGGQTFYHEMRYRGVKMSSKLYAEWCSGQRGQP